MYKIHNNENKEIDQVAPKKYCRGALTRKHTNTKTPRAFSRNHTKVVRNDRNQFHFHMGVVFSTRSMVLEEPQTSVKPLARLPPPRHPTVLGDPSCSVLLSLTSKPRDCYIAAAGIGALGFSVETKEIEPSLATSNHLVA